MINIANLLRNAKKGTILWSPLFGPVEFMQLGKDDQIWIKVDNSEPFDKYGRYFGSRFTEAECLLFPSKDCRTWENFKLPAKPKFKDGDWIVGNEGIFKITQYEDEYGYDLTDTTGCVVHFVSPDYVKSNFHLWTIIKDAKDGDVLVCYSEVKGIPIEQVGIFKRYVGRHGGCSNTFLTYTGIDWDGNIIINGYMGSTNILPATKEQRNLLFQKMKEAGYQWDAYKKELRKIKPHYDISNFHAGMPVLVRETSLNTWQYVLFSHCYIGGDGLTRFNAGLVGFTQCIPFEGNEHLLGTTDMCDEQYVNW